MGNPGLITFHYATGLVDLILRSDALSDESPAVVDHVHVTPLGENAFERIQIRPAEDRLSQPPVQPDHLRDQRSAVISG